jgi:amino acid transporter
MTDKYEFLFCYFYLVFFFLNIFYFVLRGEKKNKKKEEKRKRIWWALSFLKFSLNKITTNNINNNKSERN